MGALPSTQVYKWAKPGVNSRACAFATSGVMGQRICLGYYTCDLLSKFEEDRTKMWSLPCTNRNVNTNTETDTQTDTHTRAHTVDTDMRSSDFLPLKQLCCRNSVCSSVCPSVCHMIPHERAITLVFWHQQWLVSDAPFRLKFVLKVSYPLRKTLTSSDSAYNVSTVRDSEKVQPDFGDAFSNRTYFPVLGRFWLSSAERARRVGDEKKE